ncbi:hypothetical protein [Amorphus orientalis]|uniref:Uncharacterized protein n=1 Tax=Amorphus orientalis TaxID=649198 RepID=A0AAE3VPL8_9HYPH|nr:hypothetical protein [Amorphus orientalis]MDQ0315979.1 hypothetical protein [Amorphus orientalis]
MKYGKRLVAGALAVCGLSVAALVTPVQATTLSEIAAIRKATPSCNANPGAPWVGRVSGSVENDIDDRIIPVSFVGCFQSQPECERWKEKTSGFITGPIIQYSCDARK